MSGRLLRLVGTVVAALACAVSFAPPASADPARPTDYRSTVESIEPATDAIRVDIVGGDGFLDLQVTRGHTVSIAGYQDEPWLEVSETGVVRENQAAPTHFLNENRYGTVIPDGITVQTATDRPQWKVVARNGRFIWHDHRIHYMTPEIPPKLVPGTRRVAIGGGPDGRWQVPMVVDGTPTVVTGSLERFEAPSPVGPWLIVALVALVVVGGASAIRRQAITLGVVAVIVAAALSVWAGMAELAVVPTKAGGNPLAVALPVVAVVAVLVALMLRTPASKTIALLAGAAALGAWALLRVDALGKAFPLGSLSPSLTRGIIAVSLGAAIGAIGAAIASGGLKLQLDDLDDPDDHPAADGPPTSS